MPTAHFAADPVTLPVPPADATGSNSATVKRTGKLFEVGQIFTDRAGKRFGLTQSEAEAAVAAFTPCPMNLHHGPSVFSSLGIELGQIERVWLDGKDLNAEYALPGWLGDAFHGKPVPTSSEWDAEAKRLTGAGFVISPAVQDAVMMSAATGGHVSAEKVAMFAMTRHNTPEGQTLMQGVHDLCAAGGAVCDRGNTAQMASQHEATAAQKVHDIAANHGATCAKGEAPPWVKPANFSRQPARPANTQGDTKHMSLKDKIRAGFIALGLAEDEIPDITEADLIAPSPAQFSEADTARFAAQEREIAALRAEAVTRQAEAFAAALLTAGRIYPYEKAAVVAAFSQAAQDDAMHPTTVKFSAPDGTAKDGTRIDQVKALYAARPPHGMDRELLTAGRQLTDADFKAVFSRDSTSETPEDRAARIKAAANVERAAQGLPVKN